MNLKKYSEYVRESSKNWPPKKYKKDISKMRKLFISSDYDGVRDILKKFKDVSSGENTIDNIYYPTKYPSEEIENKYGVSISKVYNIPFGFSEEELENLNGLFMDDGKIIDIIFDELISINKTLSDFRKSSKKTVVIGGVCSRISVEDIMDYQENETEIRDYDSNKKEYIIKRIDKFYSDIYSHLSKIGIGLGYFPSMDTLLKIKSVQTKI